MSDLTVPRFEPQTSSSKDKRFTARPIGCISVILIFTLFGKNATMTTFNLLSFRFFFRIGITVSNLTVTRFE